MIETHADKIVLGWREYVSLPGWGVRRLRAKIDTGARTTAIDVNVIEDLGDGRVRFELVRRERPKRRTKWVTAELVRQSSVKPSSGQTQARPVVRTKIAIAGVEIETEVSLVSRRGMICRMLVGRNTLDASFIVDPSRRYLAGIPPRTSSKGGAS